MLNKSFKDFTILKLLGTGGMGKVYLALQNSLDRKVALKIINISNFDYDNADEIAERFIREAKLKFLNTFKIMSIL